MTSFSFDLTPKDTPRVETAWRRIVTPFPVPESLPLFADLEKYESTSMHGQLPVVWDRAEGCQVFDPWGNIWLDFTSTIFVANAGHGNPEIIRAIEDQLQKPLLHTYSYANTPRVEYVKLLATTAPAGLDKVFLLSAGTEATECALKLMRLDGRRRGKRRPGIVCFEGNWHGRTMGAQMLSNNAEQKAWIGYQDPNIFHLPFPYPWRDIGDPAAYFRDAFADLCRSQGLDPKRDICGFMLETFQGWAAAFYPEAFVREVRATADAIGALLTFDEMQSGFGRTGRLFGYEHYGVRADLLCCGKGISSSLPLSAVIGSAAIMDLPPVGSMSSTHSANPLACAAGLANLRAILDHDLVGRSARLGAVLHQRLHALQRRFPEVLSHVLGRGLVAGLIFYDPEGRPLAAVASRVCEKALRKGLLLVHTGRESIKIGPPLTIPEEALEEGLDVLAQAMAEVMEEGI